MMKKPYLPNGVAGEIYTRSFVLMPSVVMEKKNNRREEEAQISSKNTLSSAAVPPEIPDAGGSVLIKQREIERVFMEIEKLASPFQETSNISVSESTVSVLEIHNKMKRKLTFS
ncbi:hypothetical protein L6452_00707 [Arctium lappa]|uniref:Uncharacterized protein n=1 Tax=Arctium lappa TaxID=4217 RepID=A0ACB9FE40_ARCLA|nr:hypothetical protein L6452_00707 [Arctium lappa]